MAWSKKYKKSIDCSNAKGFSQKAHCAGRKKRQSGGTTKSKSVTENIMENNLNESLSKLVNDFFDGIKNNTTKRYLDKAKKAGMPKPVIDKMKQIEKEKKELDKLFQDYSK